MKTKWCNRAGKVIFPSELDAKIALAERVWKDKGEVDYYPCTGHWHLTSQKRNRGHGGALTSSAA